MENTPIIDVHGLSCKSGNNYLLHDVNWKVYPGEHWVVFGLNGSGKTTLLGAVAGFQPYTHGTLRVFGEEYSDENIFRLRRRIGFVSSSFFDKVVAEEAVINIVLSGLFGSLGVRGKVSDRARVEAEMLLATFGLEEKIDYPFKRLISEIGWNTRTLVTTGTVSTSRKTPCSNNHRLCVWLSLSHY